MENFVRISSLSELHKILKYDKPLHPLVSFIDYSNLGEQVDYGNYKFINDFYLISFKEKSSNSITYGRNVYDFDEGNMIFMAPSQVFSANYQKEKISGWGLYFHPDFILGTSLKGQIDKYRFFQYSNSEALHLSEKERLIVVDLVRNIKIEISNNIDRHSKRLIASNIELLLNYCQRFYDRQFITREALNKDVISRFENLLKSYYEKDMQLDLGLINLNYFTKRLNLSASYLSDLIKKETGKTIKEQVHLHIINMAKNELLSTNKTINEIAYDLGFNYPQYFIRLFKSKVGVTPLKYRNLN